MAPQSIPQRKPSTDAEPIEAGRVMSAWRFRLAVLMHDRAVYRVAAALLRDPREAEDVTQVVFLSYSVDDTSTQLQAAGWNNVVRVREQGEHMRIFMRPGTDGTLPGLTIMVADSGASDEAVFINVAGAIQPSQLGRIAAAIGMDGMFNMVPGIPGPGAAQKGPQ